MAYSAEIKVGEESYPIASHAPPCVGRKQATALKDYLERSPVAAKLFEGAVANGEAVTFVKDKGLYVFSKDFGVGGKNHYTLLADWVPEKSTGEATSFEARRLPGEATSFEASLAPRTATIPGRVAATAQKIVTITGLVSGEKSGINLRGIRNNSENNCFLNAALQFIIHSPLAEHFNAGIGETSEQVKEFKKFYESYKTGRKELNSADIRKVFGYELNVQDDSAEFIGNLASEFENTALQTVYQKFSRQDKGASKLNADGNWMQSVSMSSENSSLQAMLNQHFAERFMGNDLEIEGVNGPHYAERFIQENTKDLFLRMEWGVDFGKSAKKGIDIQMGEENRFKIKGEGFSLRSYVKHIGDKFTGGHYLYYLNRGSKWYCINDEMVREIKEKEFLENANKAYLMHLTAVD